jgi:hypothetical protein
MAKLKAPKTVRNPRPRKKPPKEYVEGDEAFQNFVNLTRRVLSVPKSEIEKLKQGRPRRPKSQPAK